MRTRKKEKTRQTGKTYTIVGMMGCRLKLHAFLRLQYITRSHSGTRQINTDHYNRADSAKTNQGRIETNKQLGKIGLDRAKERSMSSGQRRRKVRNRRLS